jgi:hypothetical protein
MKDVTYTLPQIKKLLSNLSRRKDSTLETISEDCNEHNCFSRSNAQSLEIGKLQLIAENELQRRSDLKHNKELQRIYDNSVKSYQIRASLLTSYNGLISETGNSIELTIKAKSALIAKSKAFSLASLNLCFDTTQNCNEYLHVQILAEA